MSSHSWQGAAVRLRAIEPGDGEWFFAASADTEALRHSGGLLFPLSRAWYTDWAQQLATAEPGDTAYRWVIENPAGEGVGTINTHSCDPRTGTFSYGLSVRAEHRRQGYGAAAIILVLRHYFAELRYQKATVHIYSFNAPALRLHERLGFQSEGRVRRTVYTQGLFFDECIFGLTAEEFAAGHPPERPEELPR